MLPQTKISTLLLSSNEMELLGGAWVKHMLQSQAYLRFWVSLLGRISPHEILTNWRLFFHRRLKMKPLFLKKDSETHSWTREHFYTSLCGANKICIAPSSSSRLQGPWLRPKYLVCHIFAYLLWVCHSLGGYISNRTGASWSLMLFKSPLDGLLIWLHPRVSGPPF